MVFLNPAVLFGVLAASIPVLIHLLNLRKLKKVDFSSLAFLKELQKSKIRRVKLKQWLLLALRILIILLIVISFARPTIESASLGGTASAAKTSAVFILDNSFSMSVVDEKGSYFNQSKEIIRKLIEDFLEGDEVLLVSTTNRHATDKDFSEDLDQVIRELEAEEISFLKGNLAETVNFALLKLSESDNFNKEIYIFSDLQGSNISKENSIQFPESEGTRLYSFNFDSDKKVRNLSISGFNLNNQILEKDKNISFTATVSNYSDLPVTGNIASLFINEKRTAQASLSLQPGETESILFETTLRETGLVKAFVELEEDDILRDNARYVSFTVPDKINILILSDNPEDSRFLRLALNNNENQQNISVRSSELNRISSLNLNQFDAVIIIASGIIPGFSRISDYIESGGGILLFPGSNSDPAYLREFCSGLNLPAPSDIIETSGDGSSGIEFSFIDFEHPLFENLFEEKKEIKIESPQIYKYMRLSSQGKGKEIIKLPDNSLFLGEFLMGKGKILLFTSAPILSWSSLPMKALFAPLIFKSIYYLSTKISDEQNQIAGAEIYISFGGKALSGIQVIYPDNREELLNLTSGDRSVLKFAETKEVGLYRFYSDGQLIDNYSINTDPGESILASFKSDEFSEYLSSRGYTGEIVNISINENFGSKIVQARFGSELWKFFLIAALIAALFEMILSKSSKKDLIEIGKDKY